MTTYTLISAGPPQRHLTAEAAAEAILTEDGYAYRIEVEVAAAPKQPATYRLWHSDGSYASPRGDRHLHETAYCASGTRAEAEAEIFAAVVRDGPAGWRNCGNTMDLMTDEEFDAAPAVDDGEDDYDRMVAEMDATPQARE